MINKKYISFRTLLIAFLIILAVMIFIGLYPFNFFTPNRVQWLSNEPGLYFNGAGIAFTEKPLTLSLKDGVSLEILLKERRDSKNWGLREIFSFYDGAASPTILLGQRGRRIFICSRFEKKSIKKWYSIFSTKQSFPKEKSHLINVTFNGIEKAIYINGQLRNKKM